MRWASNDGGFTSLMRAARNGKKEAAVFLSKYEMKHTDNEGKTALIYACQFNHPECVEFLIDEAGITDIYGLSALMYAIRKGCS